VNHGPPFLQFNAFRADIPDLLFRPAFHAYLRQEIVMTDQTNPPPQALQGQIGISAQYIKDFSFESPHAPQIFAPSKTPPELNMGVNVRTRPLGDAAHEVLLLLRLEAKLEGKSAFIAELTYGGVFVLPKLPEDQIKLLLLIECPKLLFPFARAIIADAVREGGFPQILLAPIDFAALYQANKDNVGTMTAAGAA
jgi:preprotein translocase subunit SecB